MPVLVRDMHNIEPSTGAQVLSYRNALTKPKRTANHKIMCRALVLFFFYSSIFFAVLFYSIFISCILRAARRRKKKFAAAAAGAIALCIDFNIAHNNRTKYSNGTNDSRIHS